MKKQVSLLLCGALALSLASCGAPSQSEVMDPTVVVETTTAQTGTLSSESTYIGTISAEGTASVVAMTSGTVKSVQAAVGDTVSAGQLLCKFDDAAAQLNLDSARASYASAQAGVESAQQSYQGAVAGYGGTEDGSLTILEDQVHMAQENYDNTQALFEIGAASQLEVDQAHQSLLSAQAGLETAQSSLGSAQAGFQSAQASAQAAQVGVASAEHQLTLYNLTAPISGVVEAVDVTENNFTASGSVAFVISNAKNKTVTFYVTDEVRHQLVQGQSVSVSARGTEYSGVISEISGVVDVSTGLFQIKALIDGAQELPDGLTVELATTSHTMDDAIIVPCDALYFDNGVAYIYVVQDGKAVRVTVTVGLYTSEQAAITEGLNEGDSVITTWSATLKDGVSVRLASEAGTDSSQTE